MKKALLLEIFRLLALFGSAFSAGTLYRNDFVFEGSICILVSFYAVLQGHFNRTRLERILNEETKIQKN